MELRDNITWRSYCSDPSRSCVQHAKVGDRIILRDSKDPDGGTLSFTEAEIRAFVRGCVEDGLS